MIRVLFVCMGNVCRSPTAEGVFRQLLLERKIADWVEVASAGTHAYHIGEAPDQRAQQAATRRGYDLSSIRARKVVPQDLDYFDMILAMDRRVLEELRLICPPERVERLGLFMDYSAAFDKDEVPDPYYGSGQGFDLVLDMVEDASRGLVEKIRERFVTAQKAEK